MFFEMTFKERLKGLREDHDLTQLEVAQALNITRATLANYEQGIREPDFVLLVKIANYYDVTLDYLLCRTNLKVSFKKLYAPIKKKYK
ncbi:helix-turn-helix domain-containing protein [Clostridium scatologenes]|uniref:helix-turn-helix domain-containing protein n=1 Tax=Clostridium scatologenes TaxID=1548 RepID=UPI001FA70E35|nr:helix-turn-helix transcriptional regulator [Clostridium scatologenes]